MAIPCFKHREVQESQLLDKLSVQTSSTVYGHHLHIWHICTLCLQVLCMSALFQVSKNTNTGQDFALSFRGGSWKPVIVDPCEVKWTWYVS